MRIEIAIFRQFFARIDERINSLSHTHTHTHTHRDINATSVFLETCPIGLPRSLASLREPFLTREFADSTAEPPNVAKCGRRPRLSPFMLISLIRYFHDFRTSQTCHFYICTVSDAGQADEPKTKYSRRKEIIEKQFIARAIT